MCEAFLLFLIIIPVTVVTAECSLYFNVYTAAHSAKVFCLLSYMFKNLEEQSRTRVAEWTGYITQLE